MLFTIALENYNCKIKITSTKDGVSLGTITGLKIKRKEYGDSTWTLLATKSILTMDDFNYIFIDKYTRSRRTYVYSFVPMSGTTEETASEYTIECNFDSIYISDASDEYILSLNLDFDYDPNQKISIQEPLQSEYPIIIKNGICSYETGYVQGLPLPVLENGQYSKIGTYKYKIEYVNFLKNGLKKFIKTYRGDAWFVYVDPKTKISQGEAEGAEPVKFSWIQIGATPLSDV